MPEKTVSLMKWMIVGLIVSAFNAYIYKDQDILISLIATLQRIGFLVFLFLCNSTLTLKDIEKERPELKYGKQCVSISYKREDDFLFLQKKAKEFISINVDQ